MMVAVNVRRPIPDTSFSNRLEKENIPIHDVKRRENYVSNYLKRIYFFFLCMYMWASNFRLYVNRGCNFKPSYNNVNLNYSNLKLLLFIITLFNR